MPELKDIKILIVDDYPEMRKTIRFLLKILGFRNSIAVENAYLGLKLLKQEKYDLLLLDWNLPGKNGLTMLKEIRHNSELKSLPVIMITDKVEKEEVLKAIEAGVAAYIVKPLRADLLEKKILAIFSD